MPGGILGFFEVERSPGASAGLRVYVRQHVPPQGTRFNWERGTVETRGAADTHSTSQLSAD
jgi:hypothetical protein